MVHKKFSQIKLRNANDLQMAITSYRNEVKLHEQLFYSGLRNVRKSFENSIEDSVKAYTQQWVMIKVMQWVQSAIYKRRKKKKKKKQVE